MKARVATPLVLLGIVLMDLGMLYPNLSWSWWASVVGGALVGFTAVHGRKW